MLFHEKTELVTPSHNSGSAFFSVLKDSRTAASSWITAKNREFRSFISSGASLPESGLATEVPSLGRDFGKQECPTELHGLIDVLGKVRQRILTNTFLRGSTNWWTWILAGLIVVATVSVKLAGVMTLAAILVLAGTGFLLTLVWRRRLSIYDTACRLDTAAGLRDRVSTAIFLADTRNPDEMMQLQREDALARLRKVDAGGLFPVRMPATANRALIVVIVAAGLLAYRINHKPPLISLLQTTERSQLVKSILTPLVHAMERDLQKTVAAVTKPDESSDEVRAGDTTPPPDDLWQNGDDKQNAQQDGDQGAPEAGPDDEQQNQSQSSSSQNNPSSSESQQQQQQIALNLNKTRMRAAAKPANPGSSRRRKRRIATVLHWDSRSCRL